MNQENNENSLASTQPLCDGEAEEQRQRLADEAINKIRCFFLEKFPISLFLPDENVTEIRLECLGNLLDWKCRYFSVLGKLRFFVENYPLCKQQFHLRLIDPSAPTQMFALAQNPSLVASVSNTERIGVEHDCDDDFDDMGIDDCDSVVSSVLHASPTGDELASLNDRAFRAVKTVLLARMNSEPPNSMKLTALNTSSRWYLFSALHCSLKVWALNEVRGDDTHYLVVHNGNPGNDVVQLVSRAENPLPPPNHQSHSSQLHNQHPPSSSQLPLPLGRTCSLVDSRTGMAVEDFFNIPLRTCQTELSYKKSIARISTMLHRFVQQGVINHSLCYGIDRFEELEWLGDAVLHMELTRSQFVSHSLLLDVGGLSVRRQNAEQRLTLALLFDELRIAEWVVVCPDSWVSSRWKAKGDILEAILGEIYMKLNVATEPGFLLDPKQREMGERLIQMITAAALERGPRLKEVAERASLQEAAQSSGGGGLLQTRADSDAMVRHSRAQQQALGGDLW